MVVDWSLSLSDVISEQGGLYGGFVGTHVVGFGGMVWRSPGVDATENQGSPLGDRIFHI